MRTNDEHKKALERRKSTDDPADAGSCDCGGGCRGSLPDGLGRRQFLKVAGAGFVSTSLGGRLMPDVAGSRAGEAYLTSFSLSPTVYLGV